MTHICNRPGTRVLLFLVPQKRKTSSGWSHDFGYGLRSQPVLGIEPKTLTSRLLSFPCRPFRGAHWRASGGLLSLCTEAIRVCQSEGTSSGVVPAVQGTGLGTFVGGRQEGHKQRWRKPHCLCLQQAAGKALTFTNFKEGIYPAHIHSASWRLENVGCASALP